jgi:FkbM family methyltransferase
MEQELRESRAKEEERRAALAKQEAARLAALAKNVGERRKPYRAHIDEVAEKICNFVRRQRPEIPSTSQHGQDRFVIDKIFNRKRDGFFLEIGGGDGLYLSNTLVLENDFGWRGILVEPTRAFEQLKENRPKATCVKAAIAGERRTVRLFEILDKGQAALNPDEAGSNTLLSVIEEVDEVQPDFRPAPEWAEVQQSYLVEAITLDDLLTRYGAPKVIDYFSFDVEGAEYEIFKTFPFDKWRFNCLGVEDPSPELQKLLIANRYSLVKEGELDWFYLHLDFLAEWLDTRGLG